MTAGSGSDTFLLSDNQFGFMAIENYGRNDKTVLANLAGVTVRQNGTTAELYQSSEFRASMSNTLVTDVRVETRSTRELTPFLQDPFKVQPLIASGSLA